MSKLDDLINKLCPDGVDFFPLSAVANISIGEFVHKNKQNPNGLYPVFNGGITNTGFYDEYNNEGKKVIISARGASAGYVNKIESRYWAGNSCYSIDVDTNKLNWVYAYFFLSSIQKSLIDNQQKGGIPAVSKKQIENIQIPLPPLEIQNEIVQILDKFTSLEAELEAELEARRKQYEYYRDSLLTFDDSIERIPLGEACYIKARIGWQRLNREEYLETGDYYLVTGIDIRSDHKIDFNSCYYVTKERYEKDDKIQLAKGDIIITKDGTIGKVAYIDDLDKPATLNGHLFVIRDTTGRIEARYLMYLLLSRDFNQFIEKNKSGTTIIGLTQATIINYQIPIPSLEKQRNIVSILDRFESLCNDITSGLPAEIEARHKQYEYYRDKLLTFKRKEA